MKKYLFTVLLTVLMSMVGVQAFAYDFWASNSEGKTLYYNFTGGDEVAVTRGSSNYWGRIVIPRAVKNGDTYYRVTSIAPHAFEEGSGVTYLFIPNSIQSIGEYAFIDCGNNINVDIESLSDWCNVTFGNEHSSPLSSAKTLYLNGSYVWNLFIPYGVQAIPNFAFYQCKCISSVSIPGTVKIVGSSAFEDCTGLTSLTLNEGLETIGGSAFEGCTGLKILRIPSTVNTISINAFKNCTDITDVYCFAKNVPMTDEYAFDGTPTEKSTLHVPTSAVGAYSNTWPWSDFMEKVSNVIRTIHVATAGTLPNLISDVEKYQIEELILTGELNGTDFRLIRDMAGVSFYFKNYQGAYYPETKGILKSLDISNTKIVEGGEGYTITDEGSPLYHKTRTISPEDYDYKVTKNNCISVLMFFKTKLESIILPNSVTDIEDEAFEDCSALTSIIIPSKIKSIGLKVFEGCNNLSSILVDDGNKNYKSPNNCNAIIEIGTKQLIAGCNNTIIPFGVTSIGNRAFYGCSGLTSVTIPNSITSIGSYAFSGCSGLTSVNIPNSITSIGNYAFSGCSGLTSVTIPNSVINIGDGAFSNCSGLTSISISNSVTSIGSSAFSGCSGLTSFTIPNSITSIGSYAFYGCSGLTSVTIPNNVSSIGNSAFAECCSLISMIVEVGNEKYDSRNACNAIIETSSNTLISGCKNTYIPNSIISIGDNAFYRCSSLTSMTIPNSVSSIGNNAFYECDKLTSVIIGNSVTSIGNHTFHFCRNLISVTIPSSVTSIGIGTFSTCSSLRSIISLNIIPPLCNNSIYDIDKDKCVLWVPKGRSIAYKDVNVWKDFQNIKELVEGDVNLDGKVDQRDLNALVDFIMGRDPEGFYECQADLNGDEKVNAADVVILVKHTKK